MAWKIRKGVVRVQFNLHGAGVDQTERAGRGRCVCVRVCLKLEATVRSLADSLNSKSTNSC